MESTSENLLQDIEPEFYHQPATLGMRLLNLIIDLIMYYVLSYAFGYVYAILYIASGADIENSFLLRKTGVDQLILLLLTTLIYILYYTIMEFATGGKTIGKFITKTRAVTRDGNKLRFHDALIRSLCRIIPFEWFSGLGNGLFWHDQLARTKVVQD